MEELDSRNRVLGLLSAIRYNLNESPQALSDIANLYRVEFGKSPGDAIPESAFRKQFRRQMPGSTFGMVNHAIDDVVKDDEVDDGVSSG